MSSEISSKTLDVTVVFDATTHSFTYSGDIDAENRIVVDVHHAWVELKLETVGSEPPLAAVFREPLPILWQGGTVPSVLSVWRPQSQGSVTQLAIEDRNPLPTGQPAEQVLSFALVVEYDGQAYHSPDPSIVNVDPP